MKPDPIISIPLGGGQIWLSRKVVGPYLDPENKERQIWDSTSLAEDGKSVTRIYVSLKSNWVKLLTSQQQAVYHISLALSGSSQKSRADAEETPKGM